MISFISLVPVVRTRRSRASFAALPSLVSPFVAPSTAWNRSSIARALYSSASRGKNPFVSGSALTCSTMSRICLRNASITCFTTPAFSAFSVFASAGSSRSAPSVSRPSILSAGTSFASSSAASPAPRPKRFASARIAARPPTLSTGAMANSHSMPTAKPLPNSSRYASGEDQRRQCVRCSRSSANFSTTCVAPSVADIARPFDTNRIARVDTFASVPAVIARPASLMPSDFASPAPIRNPITSTHANSAWVR